MNKIGNDARHCDKLSIRINVKFVSDMADRLSFFRMEQVRVSFTSEMLENISKSVMRDDFTFVVFGHELKCDSILAEILSPNVSRIHRNDPSFNRFVVMSDNKGSIEDAYNIFGLISGKDVIISDDKIDLYLDVFNQLGNT